MRSLADLVMGPALSKKLLSVNMPSLLMRPRVGLMAYTAARHPGVTREPMVSVPIESGAKPAATPAADPDEEPPGACYHEKIALSLELSYSRNGLKYPHQAQCRPRMAIMSVRQPLTIQV
jgi:hypothetical protein